MRSGKIFSLCPTSAAMAESLKGLTARDEGGELVGDACEKNDGRGAVFDANISRTRRWNENGNENSL